MAKKTKKGRRPAARKPAKPKQPDRSAYLMGEGKKLYSEAGIEERWYDDCLQAVFALPGDAKNWREIYETKLTLEKVRNRLVCTFAYLKLTDLDLIKTETFDAIRHQMQGAIEDLGAAMHSLRLGVDQICAAWRPKKKAS